MMSTRKTCDLYSICFYANVILVFYFASAYTDPLDVKSLEDLYGLLKQPSKLTGWMATGGDPCGQNWTGVSCSASSIISLPHRFSDKIRNISYWCRPHPSDLSIATNDCSREVPVGAGLIGSVFKALFPDGLVLAIKRLEVVQIGFLNLVLTMSDLKHANICILQGYYARNGSICSLFSNNRDSEKCLSWKLRLRIALGVAHALDYQYMHEICSPPIAHGNIKAGNVLFDEEFVPFTMLSHILPTTSMDFKMFGGSGYTAPEMSIPGSDMIKGHIFSFGVLLQELLAAALAMILAVYLNLQRPSSVGVAFIGALFVLPILQVAAANQAVKDDETLLAIYVGLGGLIGTAAAIMAIPHYYRISNLHRSNNTGFDKTDAVLAQGPEWLVRTYQGYDINGYTFTPKNKMTRVPCKIVV